MLVAVYLFCARVGSVFYLTCFGYQRGTFDGELATLFDSFYSTILDYGLYPLVPLPVNAPTIDTD
jgi:hypothetical protein